MRVTVVAFEIPYPPVHGGVVDIWRRLKSMARMGVEIQLLGWKKAPLTSEEERALKAHAKEVHVFHYRSGLSGSLRRVIELLHYPLEVTSRTPTAADLARAKAVVGAFKPDLIIADQLHSGALALPLRTALGFPLVYRSHNIEYRYWMEMFHNAHGFEKIKRFFSVVHLHRYERNMLESCDAFFDISEEDLGRWRASGFSGGHLLPPLIEWPGEPPPTGSADDGYDVVFMGNLRSPNNIHGVTWFLHEVLPHLAQKRPEITVLLAGSNPAPEVAEACDSAANVGLLANPANAADVYRSGRVLINPVATGSGVALKTLDMLAAGRPIVSVSRGVIGLPAAAKACFQVADEPAAFAEAISRCLEGKDGAATTRDRDILDAAFGDNRIRTFLKELEALLPPGRSPAHPAPVSRSPR